jgi:hypothetical protein
VKSAFRDGYEGPWNTTASHIWSTIHRGRIVGHSWSRHWVPWFSILQDSFRTRRCSSCSVGRLRRGRAECHAGRDDQAIAGTTRLSDLTPAKVSTVPYQTARLLELFNIDIIEDLVQLVVFSPVLGVFELLICFLRYKTTCAQVAPVHCQCPATARGDLQS